MVHNGDADQQGAGRVVTPSNKPRTILYVHNNNDMYGAEVILLELLKGLDREQFHPIVALPNDTKHIGRLSSELAKAEIEYYFVRMAILRRKYMSLHGIFSLVFDFMVGLVQLIVLIGKTRAVIVHTNTISVLCSPFAAWFTKRKHIWHIHEIVLDPRPVRRLLHNLCCRLSFMVVAVSGAVRDHVLVDCPQFASKVVVIHNGINHTAFDRGSTVPSLRGDFEIPSQARLVGMIGRVCRWKGQMQFVDAAALVLKRRPDTYFLAVGGVFDQERFYMEQFRQAVKERGLEEHFRISDFRTDAPDIVGTLDIFVLPSTQPDPFPTVVLEAMAAGKPVIAAAHGGPLEMVLDGETGYLVKPCDHVALADAILKMLEDPDTARLMGENGRSRAAKLFAVERFVNEFEQLYNNCLETSFPRLLHSMDSVDPFPAPKAERRRQSRSQRIA